MLKADVLRNTVDIIRKNIVYLGRSLPDVGFVPYATGFFTEAHQVVVAVTAQHVVLRRGTKEINEDLSIAVRQRDGSFRTSKVSEIRNTYQNQVNWILHPGADVAAIPFLHRPGTDDLTLVVEHGGVRGQELCELMQVCYPTYQQTDIELTEIRPIFRVGHISDIRPDGTFLIDGAAFPGNSGSPVFTAPSHLNLVSGFDRPLLVGLISGYRTYRERAVSEHTGEPRIEFVENTGLSECCPFDAIDELLHGEEFRDMLERIKPLRGL